MDLAARKSRLRAEMLARRRAIPRGEAEAAAASVAERVAGLPEFAAARSVALYAALADELPSRALFDLVCAAGKLALLPRFAPEGLEFAAVRRWEELRLGRYGVLAPPPEAPRGDPDLVLVPGVAFDRQGRRLGRGGGHYDRVLARGPGFFAIGIAYETQLVEEVPHGEHDCTVDAIVTESAVHHCGRRA